MHKLPVFRDILQVNRRSGTGHGREHDRRRREDRHNLLDIHGIIFFTAPAPPCCARNRSTRSASASRPAVLNGALPAATTVNGSAPATSVHPAGSENKRPSSSCRWTRSSPQFWR